MIAAFARPFAGMFALIAALVLSACGGGSGAPNNPFAPVFTPGTLLVLPAAPTIYSQVAATLTISGGTAPFRAFSSNSAVLPVTQVLPGDTLTLLAGNVSALTTATVTIQDSGGQTASVDVTILPGPATPPLALTVLPNPVDIFSQIAAQLTINGGVPPYRAFSSNGAVLPVAAAVTGNILTLLANAVSANTVVTVTVQDSVNQTASVAVTVHPKAVSTSPLVVLPQVVTTSKQTPATVTISGGAPPYQAYSSNPGLLPVPQNLAGNALTLAPAPGVTISSNQNVTVTIQDSAGQTTNIAVTVAPEVSTPPPPLAVLPATSIVFSNVPATLTVTGGVPPYTAFSSNPAVLPVLPTVTNGVIALSPATVAADTTVTVSVKDAVGTTATASVTVRPAAFLNALTITPNSTECGTNAICSGQTGTATVTLLAPGGGPAAGRQVRFDVVAGPFGFVSGGTTVQSLLVTSDVAGHASAIILANVAAPTQFAQLRVTDIASGQQLTGSFVIQQVTNGSTILTVIPSDVTITGPFIGECSVGARVDYFIYGGTPPYRVTSSFPGAGIIFNSPVTASGGFFEFETNGTCVNPMTFSIVDATGRQTTALLRNVPGTLPAPTPPEPGTAALTVNPTSNYTRIVGPANCPSQLFNFGVGSGTPPYSVFTNPAGPTFSFSGSGTQASFGPGDAVTVTNVQAGVTTVFFRDSGAPQQTVTRTITCS